MTARRLRAAGRSPAGLAAIRPALGPALARPGPLCRVGRLPAGRLSAPTPGVIATMSCGPSTPTSPTTASSPSSSPATSSIPDDPELRVATGYLRLGTYEYNQRNVARAVGRHLQRHHRRHRRGLPRPEHRLCPLPRPQVRPDPPEGLLPAPGVLHAALAPRRLDAGASAGVRPISARAARPGRRRRPASSAQIDAIERPYRDKGTPRRVAKFPDEIKAILAKPDARSDRRWSGSSARWLTARSPTSTSRCPSVLKGSGQGPVGRAAEGTQALRCPAAAATGRACWRRPTSGRSSPPTVIPGDRKQERDRAGISLGARPLAGSDRAPARGSAIHGPAAGPGSLAGPARQSRFRPA